MSTSFPADLQQFVAAEITSGRYRSEEELLCEALRLLRSQRLYKLRQEVRIGADQLQCGQATKLADDEELLAFFADIESDVHNEIAAEQ